MNQSPDYSKISITAKLVAYFRQFSDIPFVKEIAQYIGADQVFQNLLHENVLHSDELVQYYALTMEA